ncbi:hypothetical protein AG1IA_08134 [Rhizoctonia solani AG-1 IA]|uniref:Uncharacterized protein n=1 Tax=Thanatephorus cucumeris (strain AG1-IA) TaxID=983506 RepID=L8WNB9_THACA|nr:hypothetical protein AG1IA_08134 [Rhizoctonia solani AG-1 IA]
MVLLFLDYRSSDRSPWGAPSRTPIGHTCVANKNIRPTVVRGDKPASLG